MTRDTAAVQTSTGGALDDFVKTLAIRLSRRRMVANGLVAISAAVVLRTFGLKTQIAYATVLGCTDCYGPCEFCYQGGCYNADCWSPAFTCIGFSGCCSPCNPCNGNCGHHFHIFVCDDCDRYSECINCGACPCV
jgi:hypothetical protein